jgi:hypothetical protein
MQALDDKEIEREVTRTLWALNVHTRTLRTEIDLPNKGARLRPSMKVNPLPGTEERPPTFGSQGRGLFG